MTYPYKSMKNTPSERLVRALRTITSLNLARVKFDLTGEGKADVERLDAELDKIDAEGKYRRPMASTQTHFVKPSA